MKRATIALLLLVAGFGLLELAARYSLNSRHLPPVAIPDEYAKSIWFDPTFQAESAHADQRHYTDNGYWIQKDFTGQYINIRNGQRVTVGQPTTHRATIWLFGNSAALGLQVADKDTFASQLQRLMPSYRVVNLATQGSISIHHYARLQDTPITRGDIVIFFSGVTESESPYVTLYNRQQAAFNAHPCIDLYYQPINTVKVLCEWVFLLGTPQSETATAETEYLLKRHKATLTSARQYTESKGATFYYFLQPILRSKALSPNERVLESHWWPNDMIQYRASAWPRLQAITQEVGGYDLTHLLDAERAKGREFYVDISHVNEHGHAIIAQRIADAIQP